MPCRVSNLPGWAVGSGSVEVRIQSVVSSHDIRPILSNKVAN